MALNAKQEQFCLEYVKDLNASAAYMRVYKKVTDSDVAKACASKLLANANVSRRISELKCDRADRVKLSGDMVIKRLADIAFAHIGLIATWDENGMLILKDVEGLKESELAAIDHIQCSPVSDGDGGLLGYKRQVKMKDSLKALELLSRHLGLLDGNNKGDGDSEAAAKRILEALRRVRNKQGSNSPSDAGGV